MVLAGLDIYDGGGDGGEALEKKKDKNVLCPCDVGK